MFKKIKLNKHMKVKVIILVHQAKTLAPTYEEALGKSWSGVMECLGNSNKASLYRVPSNNLKQKQFSLYCLSWPLTHWSLLPGSVTHHKTSVRMINRGVIYTKCLIHNHIIAWHRTISKRSDIQSSISVNYSFISVNTHLYLSIFKAIIPHWCSFISIRRNLV